MRRTLVFTVTVLAACGGDPEPPPPTPDAGPLPCALSASTDRLEVPRGGSAKLVLDVPMGDCTIDRIRLDRDVFQIAAEPMWPFTFSGGTKHDLTIEHHPVGVLPAGVPIRELVFFEADHTIEVALVGDAPPQACLRITEEQIVIRGVAISETGEADVVIANDCDRVARIVDGDFVEGEQSFSFDRRALPLSVPAMGTASLTARFAPIVNFPVGGKLRLETDESQNPTLEVDLVGFPVGPRAGVFPERVELGDVLHRPGASMTSECGSRDGWFAISNEGERDLTVQSVTAGGDLHVVLGTITLAGAPVTTPFTISAGGAARVGLRAFPTREGAHQAQVTVSHNGGDPVSLQVDLQGVPSSSARERWTQPPEPRVDVLWVIQDSFALRPRSDALVALGNEVLVQLETARAQSRIGVTTTDIVTERAGELRACHGQPDIQRSEEATLADRSKGLGCALTLRNPPTGAQGIGAAVRTISRWLGRGFLRSDAELVVIVASPYDDGSSIDRAVLADFFAELPGRRVASGVRVFSVTPATACDVAVEATPRYAALATATGGASFDYCDTDWRGAATPIAALASTSPREFRLSGQPVLASFAVTVDGALVPGRRFSLDAAAGRLSFTDPPLGGRQIEVTYDPACVP